MIFVSSTGRPDYLVAIVQLVKASYRILLLFVKYLLQVLGITKNFLFLFFLSRAYLFFSFLPGVNSQVDYLEVVHGIYFCIGFSYIPCSACPFIDK